MAPSNRPRRWLLALAVAATLGCAPGVRTGGGKKGLPPAKYVETFFKGEGKTLYFIKPLPWKETSSGDVMMVDITYDHDPAVPHDAVIKFTFPSEKMVAPVTQVEVISSGEPQVCTSPQKVFVEPGTKAGYVNRFECSLPFAELKRLVATPSPHLRVTHQGGTQEYAVTPKWGKKVSAFLQRHVIDMVEMANHP